MNRLTRMTLQIFVIAVTTLTASHWKGDSENAGAAQGFISAPPFSNPNAVDRIQVIMRPRMFG
jgi:hypothetical protein